MLSLVLLALFPTWVGAQLPFHVRPGLPLEIRPQADRVVLAAPHAKAGQARAWMALEDAPRLTEEKRVVLSLRGNNHKVRFSLFFLVPGSDLYRWVDTTLTVPDTLTHLAIPLGKARKVYASAFPGALSTSGAAPLILIVENTQDAPFYLELFSLTIEGSR